MTPAELGTLKRPGRLHPGRSDRGALLLLALSTLVACSHRQGRASQPVFTPDANTRVVLPILDPLWMPELAVRATVFGSQGQSATFWMLVDSGQSAICAVPQDKVQALGLPHLGSSDIWGLDGYAHGEVVSAPRLVLGDLVVSALPVFVAPEMRLLQKGGVLGQQVLGRSPWEIDWDRGTLTLGATPWANAAEINTIVLRPSSRFGYDEIVVQVDGHPLPMVFDTGAYASAIPIDLARELHLAVAKRRPPPTFGFGPHFLAGVSRPLSADEIYTGDLRVGSLTLPAHPFVGLQKGLPAILGRDVLTRFNLQVIPGQRLMLRPRGDLRATARARLARWPGLGACASPACVQATIEPQGEDVRIELEFEAEIVGPMEIIFACATQPLSPEPFPTDAELALRDLPPPPYHHIALIFQTVKAGHRTATAPLSSRWFAPDGSGCRTLTALDAFPAPEGDRAPGDYGAITP